MTSSDKKLVIIIGARPQFIKVAVVSKALSRTCEGVRQIFIHTGQHFDSEMSQVFFDELGIPPPDYNLGLGNLSHGAMTGRQLELIEKILIDEQPNAVVVFGDTNSTLSGALAAAKLNLPVVHVEAGLRSNNRRMPEEINRILTDHIASLLFAPTQNAKRLLLQEGVSDLQIHVVGDVMYDAAMIFKKFAVRPVWFTSTGAEIDEFVLCTIHRAENTDDRSRLASILAGLTNANVPVILPIHPRTRACLEKWGLAFGENISIVPPVGYFEMEWLEMNCRLIATDSGGIQKEAFFHRKPCVTLRDETEWQELVDGGFNAIVGADAKLISHRLTNMQFPSDHVPDLYGAGNSSDLIAEIVAKQYF